MIWNIPQEGSLAVFVKQSNRVFQRRKAVARVKADRRPFGVFSSEYLFVSAAALHATKLDLTPGFDPRLSRLS